MGLSAADLAIKHWNKTPLFVSEEERYGIYPWLPEAAEFDQHRGRKVLEVGCGTGCDLLQFAKNGAIAHGIDITEEHLRLAKERVGDMAEVRYGDGRGIPYPDAYFDYVYSHGVIMCSDEPRRIVEEIWRVLKPGGRFNVHLYAYWSYFHLWKFLKHGRKWKLHVESGIQNGRFIDSADPVYMDLYTARSCRALFAPAKIAVTKRQCKPLQSLAPLFGWYLIVKGCRP
ncbi:MAG: class I SAM-dependent methyltransferase [Candidatus Sulfotelmatobacter sp.]